VSLQMGQLETHWHASRQESPITEETADESGFRDAADGKDHGAGAGGT